MWLRVVAVDFAVDWCKVYTGLCAEIMNWNIGYNLIHIHVNSPGAIKNSKVESKLMLDCVEILNEISRFERRNIKWTNATEVADVQTTFPVIRLIKYLNVLGCEWCGGGADTRAAVHLLCNCPRKKINCPSYNTLRRNIFGCDHLNALEVVSYKIGRLFHFDHRWKLLNDSKSDS